MTGKFKKSYARIIIAVLLALFGTAEAVFLGGEMIRELQSGDIPSVLFSASFVVGGIALGALGLLLLSFNRNASLKVSGERIEAEYGFSKSASVAISDIIDVTLVLNKLTIETRADTYEIEGLENASEIYEHINRQIKPRIDLSHIDEEDADYKKSIKRTKLFVVFTVICVIMLFVNLFLCVILTGERDLPDFTPRDEIIFYIFYAIEALTLALTFICCRALTKQAQLSMRQNSYLTKAKGKRDRKLGLEQYPSLVSVHYYDHYATRIIVIEEGNKYLMVIEVYNAMHGRWSCEISHDIEYDTLSELYSDLREIADEVKDEDEE